MKIPGSNAHITYCLNIYPAVSLEDIELNIFTRAAETFAKLQQIRDCDGPFGLGLWIPADLLQDFSKAEYLKRIRAQLDKNNMYVFTMNGFPFGRFHGTRVKEQVYKPDWSRAERLKYTCQLADALAAMLPEGIQGSISTVPVTFRDWAKPASIQQAVENLADSAAHLAELEKQSGRCIILALEPEPGCYLETAADTIAFFNQHLRVNGRSYLNRNDALDIINKHIGICYDTIHAAVMGEDPQQALELLYKANIPIAKIHLGAAVITDGEGSPREALQPFADEVYFHQTRIINPDGTAAMHLDLPDALKNDPIGEWRVHYHIPLTARLNPPLSSSADLISSAFLQSALEAGASHFEVETYTLNVMPGFDGNIEQAMAREMDWVMRRFEDGVAERLL